MHRRTSSIVLRLSSPPLSNGESELCCANLNKRLSVTRCHESVPTRWIHRVGHWHHVLPRQTGEGASRFLDDIECIVSYSWSALDTSSDAVEFHAAIHVVNHSQCEFHTIGLSLDWTAVWRTRPHSTTTKQRMDRTQFMLVCSDNRLIVDFGNISVKMAKPDHYHCRTGKSEYQVSRKSLFSRYLGI